MKLKILFLSLITFSVVLTANAQELYQGSISQVISAYRLYKDVNDISINVPTVVEVPFADEFIERFDFAVLDKIVNSFEPHFFKQETLTNEIPVSVSTSPNTNSAGRMNDNDLRTYAEFPLPDNAQGNVQITLLSTNSITSSVLTVLLDKNVALPSSIEIRAFVDGQSRIVVANQMMDQETIRFPQTTSSKWIITFIFGQPLRISELRLNQDNATKSSIRAIRFLAQPDHSYRIYFDPDRSATALVGESGNLVSAKDIFIVPAVPSQNNPNYIIADVDGDGVPDIHDNCVSVINSDQQDVNNNKRGDACDDFDQDGLINSKDNCPDNPNLNQQDTDSDGIGDICDKEESRITERYTWIPWVGIGFAAVVLIILLVLMAKSARETN
ncbi:thrombospondin type 3 repeat-containing protein [Candidatus Peregrinibacteria bacterium]|nr:thrombospondin type 3 repeat-containing protein [Candidatus Peregrinibacteria bacterium]